MTFIKTYLKLKCDGQDLITWSDHLGIILCLTEGVIALLLLSCCEGINDQDKTIILLPQYITIIQRKEFIALNREKQ